MDPKIGRFRRVAVPQLQHIWIQLYVRVALKWPNRKPFWQESLHLERNRLGLGSLLAGLEVFLQVVCHIGGRIGGLGSRCEDGIGIWRSFVAS